MDNFLAGGSNSPIPNWEGYPVLVRSGHGAKVVDTNGTEFIDMWMGYGALIFGHAPDFLVKNISDRLADGWFFSYPTELEVLLAKKLHEIIPCAETVRFATTGSDAVAYAVRAARAFTNRQDVIKVSSSYHGVHENLVSNRATISPVLPASITYGDSDEAEELLKSRKYACLIIEPILANAGTVPPPPGYLDKLRELCTKYETLLIFDEVVTGFRVNRSGAQKEFDVKPDLATFSKAIAGGLPLSAVCGRKEILDVFMPSGDVFFAGTFNGAPLALAASLAVIDELSKNPPYEKTNGLRMRIAGELTRFSEELGLKISIQGYGSMMSLAFDTDNFTSGIRDSKASEEKYIKYVKYLAAEHRLLLPPLFTETIFLSPAHLNHEEEIIEALKAGLKYIAQE